MLKFRELKFDGMFTPVKFQHGMMHYRVKHYEDINNGSGVYELHIGVDENYRGKGYAAEMIKAFLHKKDGTAYIAYGRILNPLLNNVIKKIGITDEWDVTELEDGYLIQEKQLKGNQMFTELQYQTLLEKAFREEGEGIEFYQQFLNRIPSDRKFDTVRAAIDTILYDEKMHLSALAQLIDSLDS